MEVSATGFDLACPVALKRADSWRARAVRTHHAGTSRTKQRSKAKRTVVPLDPAHVYPTQRERTQHTRSLVYWPCSDEGLQWPKHVGNFLRILIWISLFIQTFWTLRRVPWSALAWLLLSTYFHSVSFPSSTPSGIAWSTFAYSGKNTSDQPVNRGRSPEHHLKRPPTRK